VYNLQWRSQDFKVGGTPVTWPKRPMRGWGFWGGAAQRAPPHQLRGLGKSCHYPHPTPEKNIGFARILWPWLSTVGGGGRAPVCSPRVYATDNILFDERHKCDVM